MSADRAGSALTGTERLVAELWHEVLEVSDPLAADDDFFALGGDSVGMVTVLFRIKEEIDIELPAGAIFSAPTLRELASVVDASLARSRPPE